MGLSIKHCLTLARSSNGGLSEHNAHHHDRKDQAHTAILCSKVTDPSQQKHLEKIVLEGGLAPLPNVFSRPRQPRARAFAGLRER